MRHSPPQRLASAIQTGPLKELALPSGAFIYILTYLPASRRRLHTCTHQPRGVPLATIRPDSPALHASRRGVERFDIRQDPGLARPLHTAPHTGTRLPHASVAHFDGDYLGLETAGVPFFYEAYRGSPHR